MKLKSNETVLEANLNHEIYAEDKEPKDPIEEIVEGIESIRDIEEKIFTHMQELEEKYPTYVDFRYVKETKTHGDKGYSAWFNLVGISSEEAEPEEETGKTVTFSVTKGAGKTSTAPTGPGTLFVGGMGSGKSVASGMGIGAKSPLSYADDLDDEDEMEVTPGGAALSFYDKAKIKVTAAKPNTKTKMDVSGSEPIWTQKDGTKIAITKMSDRHLINSRNMVVRNRDDESNNDAIIVYEGHISLLEGEMARRGIK